MLLPPSVKEILSVGFKQVQEMHTDAVWQKLSEMNIEEMVNLWLSTFNHLTQINYTSGVLKFYELGVLDPFMTLQAFSFVNHEAVIDRIKLVDHWSECTRQSRAACYISFTRFLSRRFPDIFRKAMPSREGTSKTFFRVHEKVVTSAMTQAQWLKFFEALQTINRRDALIAKIILQGGKRVSEVLKLQTHQINWDLNEISFTQAKTKGREKQTIITYSENLIHQLKQYIGERTGFVFVTRFGRPVKLNQLSVTFAKAGKDAGLPDKITPHVLRASAVTFLKQQGFPDSDIMGVTGHASSEMIYAYDKRSRADNASKKVNLIS